MSERPVKLMAGGNTHWLDEDFALVNQTAEQTKSPASE